MFFILRLKQLRAAGETDEQDVEAILDQIKSVKTHSERVLQNALAVSFNGFDLIQDRFHVLLVSLASCAQLLQSENKKQPAID